MPRVIPFVVVALLLIRPHRLAAQAEHCFRPAPPPACSGFITFELEYGKPVLQSKSLNTFQTPNGVEQARLDDVDPYLMWRLGHMWNNGERSAVGASLDVGFSGRGLRLGVEGAKRYWMTNHQALDLSLGVVQLGVARDRANGETVGRAALTGAVQYSVNDLIAAMVRADVAPGSHTAAALYAGGQLRSSFAVIGTGVVGLGVALLIQVMSDPNY